MGRKLSSENYKLLCQKDSEKALLLIEQSKRRVMESLYANTDFTLPKRKELIVLV
jgi:hypothetical protein